MRNGEIVDLSNERRLSAVLDFTQAGAELLILNGGSRAEEFSVVTASRRRVGKERRAAYCIDSGTSMMLTVPLARGESPRDMTLRIIGGHGEMVLSTVQRPPERPLMTVRVWSAIAAALVLSLLAGGHLDSTAVLASADPEPGPIDDPLVQSRVSLRPPTRLPNVIARAAFVHRRVVTEHPPKLAERHVLVTAMAPQVKRAVNVPNIPAPRMTDLRVPSTAKSGDFVTVSFGAIARQVKIVASIGPTVVSKTIISAQHGMVAIKSPKSDLDSRVMTVRAYAQNGNRTSTLQAMVILVHP